MEFTASRRENSKDALIDLTFPQSHTDKLPASSNDEREKELDKTPSPRYNSNGNVHSFDARRSSTSMAFLSTPMRKSRRVSNEFAMESLQHLDHHNDFNNNALSIPQSPSAKTRLMPPTTPKSRHTEVFLSPSPKLKSPGVYKESVKPIREISNNLKTRLNYALVKLQNGWVDKTLPELENELEEEGNAKASTQSRRRTSSYSNIYACDNDDNDSNAMFLGSRKVKHNSDDNKTKNNNEANDGTDTSTSAHLAFLKAISNTTGKKPEKLSTSPMHWQQNRNSPQKKPAPEVEAIETLMSLSSPKKPNYSDLSSGENHKQIPPPQFLLNSKSKIKLKAPKSGSFTRPVALSINKSTSITQPTGSSEQQRDNLQTDIETDVEPMDEDDDD